jgi:transposase
MSLSSPTPRPSSSSGPAPAENEQCQEVSASTPPAADADVPRRRLRHARRLARPVEGEGLTGAQRLLLLDTWRRSGLPAGDFAPLVGVSKHTLYAWKRKFETEGPAGLEEKPRGGPTGSRLPEVTRRTILMLKQDNPEWGCERISSMLLRGPALPASPQAVARVLHEAGYELEEVPTHSSDRPWASRHLVSS